MSLVIVLLIHDHFDWHSHPLLPCVYLPPCTEKLPLIRNSHFNGFLDNFRGFKFELYPPCTDTPDTPLIHLNIEWLIYHGYCLSLDILCVKMNSIPVELSIRQSGSCSVTLVISHSGFSSWNLFCQIWQYRVEYPLIPIPTCYFLHQLVICYLGDL